MTRLTHFPPDFLPKQIAPSEFAQAFATLGSQLLRPSELTSLANISLSLHVPANSILFLEGTIQPYLFLIESGRIHLQMRAPGRPNVNILSLGTGQLLAWSALNPNQPMTCSANTTAPSTLLAIPSPQLLALVNANPSFGVAFYQRITNALSQRLTATRLQLLDLYHPHQS
jgi:CRP/FNR family cyclic AMP-dependent transcriptional regulator